MIKVPVIKYYLCVLLLIVLCVVQFFDFEQRLKITALCIFFFAGLITGDLMYYHSSKSSESKVEKDKDAN